MKKHPYHKAFEVVRSGYNRLGNLYTLEREKADNWKEVNAFTSLLPANGRSGVGFIQLTSNAFHRYCNTMFGPQI